MSLFVLYLNALVRENIGVLGDARSNPENTLSDAFRNAYEWERNPLYAWLALDYILRKDIEETNDYWMKHGDFDERDVRVPLWLVRYLLECSSKIRSEFDLIVDNNKTPDRPALNISKAFGFAKLSKDIAKAFDRESSLRDILEIEAANRSGEAIEKIIDSNSKNRRSWLENKHLIRYILDHRNEYDYMMELKAGDTYWDGIIDRQLSRSSKIDRLKHLAQGRYDSCEYPCATCSRRGHEPGYSTFCEEVCRAELQPIPSPPVKVRYRRRSKNAKFQQKPKRS